jgi:para-nitrobenzyl esterase
MTTTTTTITTRMGTVEGVRKFDVDHFLGIRYAQAPIGERRFRPPVPAGPWNGVHDATRVGNRACQPPAAEIFGKPGPGRPDEDCLFLNVFTPAADDRRRPVLCWIHGGAYTTGSGNDYNGSVLAAQGDVVVVTINYRLGALGFLDLSRLDGSYAGSASNGFRDQIAALEWIAANIADYGGDPDDVTIFGESAGGGSVLALLAAPAADGLFHKAIAHSPGGVNLPPLDWAPRLGEHLDGDGPLLDRLRTASADELIAAQVAVGFAGGDIDGTVVTRHPIRAIEERGDAGVPLVVGSNLDEATLFSAGQDPDAFDRGSRAIARQVVRGGDVDAYLTALAATYPDDTAFDRAERVWVDLFRRTAVDAALAATAAGPGGWLYRFDLPTTVLDGRLGATHASEIAFTFNWVGGGKAKGLTFHDPSDPVVQELAETWSNTVLAFARSGDPNGGGLPQWEPYGEPRRACLILDAEPRLEDDPDGAHRELWT